MLFAQVFVPGLRAARSPAAVAASGHHVLFAFPSAGDPMNVYFRTQCGADQFRTPMPKPDNYLVCFLRGPLPYPWHAPPVGPCWPVMTLGMHDLTVFYAPAPLCLVLKEPIFFWLRTAPRDHQPPTVNRHQPPTASRQPPIATNHG